MGNENSFTRPTICSLVPGGTEILCELGLAENIVGISDLCSHIDGMADVPIVSSSKVVTEGYSSAEVEAKMQQIKMNNEPLYAIDESWFNKNLPEIIITQDNCKICEIDVEYVNNVIRKIDYLPQVVTVNPTSISDVYGTISDIGYVTGKKYESQTLITSLKKRVESIIAKTQTYELKKIISIEGVNPLVLGGNWIPEMYRIAGGNYGLLANSAPAERIDVRDLLLFDPDFIIVDLCSSDFDRQISEINWLFQQKDFGRITASKNKDIYILNHEYFSSPGLKIFDGIEIIYRILHPEDSSVTFPQDSGFHMIRQWSGRSEYSMYQQLV
jgi:iron complex transport system substrate-binding protein